MSLLKQAFGSAIRRRREALNLSQEALAERAQLHRTYISLLERGSRAASIETVMKLAEALGTTGSELLREIEEV